MSKHISFKETVLTARYDSEINQIIPADAIEVPDDLFFRTINEPDGVWSLVAGDILKLPHPAPSFESLAASMKMEINAAAEASIAAIKSNYSASEVLSWDKQESEARIYMADANASTPMLDAMCTARGISKVDLVNRVIAKADRFAQLAGEIIGKRQALEDQINALPASATVADLEAISATWK